MPGSTPGGGRTTPPRAGAPSVMPSGTPWPAALLARLWFDPLRRGGRQRRRPLARLRGAGLREDATVDGHACECRAEREGNRPDLGPWPVVAAVHSQRAEPEAAPTSPRTARTSATRMTGLGRKRSRAPSTCPSSLDRRPVT